MFQRPFPLWNFARNEHNTKYRQFIDSLSTPFELQVTTSRVFPEDTTHPQYRVHSASSLIIHVVSGYGTLYVDEKDGFRSINLTPTVWVRIPRGVAYYIDTVHHIDPAEQKYFPPPSLICISSPPIYSFGMGDVQRAINEGANLQSWQIPESDEPVPRVFSFKIPNLGDWLNDKVADLSDENFSVFFSGTRQSDVIQSFEVDSGIAFIIFILEGPVFLQKEGQSEQVAINHGDALLIPATKILGTEQVRYFVRSGYRGAHYFRIMARDRRE